MADNIIEEWLKSLDLAKHAQAFIDNGYDDLEICKQIGDPDLDAIGVQSADERGKILRAVKDLNEKGGVSVYLTLEDQNRNSKNDTGNEASEREGALPSPSPSTPTPGGRFGEGTPVLTYPRLQLAVFLRDKLIEDKIDLANPPYTTENLSPCHTSMLALAMKYASELRTYVDDVLLRLEELRWWRVREDSASIYSPPSVASMTSSNHEDVYNASMYSCTSRTGPPPLPVVPPPDGSHLDGYGEMQSVHTRYGYANGQSNYVALETGMCCIFPNKANRDKDGEKKKTSTLGKLFRNMGFRRSSRKHHYKQHKGDLCAQDITMGDSDRIALMQMVKEGKISTDMALDVVKRYEEDRKREDSSSSYSSVEREKHSSKSKSKKSHAKPTKSPSVVYSEEEPRCDICHSLLSGVCSTPTNSSWQDPMEGPFGCCRHRRVHSVSHIDYPDPSRSPESGRAVSCSPMRSQSSQPTALNSPVNYPSSHHHQSRGIYSPVVPHEMKMYSGIQAVYAMHGMDMLRDRLNVIKTSACVHKTPSKASLISSGSDHSMECSNHMATHSEMMMVRGENPYYCSSAISTSSDMSPAPNGRRKYGGTLEKLQIHKWQRTGSCSAGDDGMSTDNDDQDDAEKRLLGRSNGGSMRVSEKFRDMRNEIKRRILQTRDIVNDGKSHSLSPVYQTTSQSVSSTDSGHSGSSGHGPPVENGHIGWEAVPAMHFAPVIGHARVHTDYCPGPGERDFLVLKRGDQIRVLEISNSGVWKGVLESRIGYIRATHVDLITETTPVSQRKERARKRFSRRSRPKSVEELLHRIGLEHLTNVFLLNGYDNLEIFGEIDEEDLNALNIHEPEYRAKLLTAAELLLDVDNASDSTLKDGYSASTTPVSLSQTPWSYLPSRPSAGSRDSGCYDSSEYLMNKEIQEGLQRLKTSNPENKENQKPVYSVLTKKGMKMGISANNSNKELCENSDFTMGATNFIQRELRMSKSDRETTDDDSEVCEITHSHSCNQNDLNIQCTGISQSANLVKDLKLPTSRLSTPKHLNVLGPDWRYFVDEGSQTSPKYGSLCDSYTASVNGDVLGLENGIPSGSAYGGTSPYDTPKKPYPKKLPSSNVEMKDAQVQVMCPLGLSNPQSSLERPMTPQTPIIMPNLASERSEGNPTQSETNPTQPDKRPTRIPCVPQTLDMSGASSDSSVKSRGKIIIDGKGQMTPEVLYGPIHKGFKSIKRSLIPRVTSKLASENIDLAQEPYSSQEGEGGIPPLLIQRYAEELKQDLYRVALVLDQVRIHKLTTVDRNVIPSEKLMESSNATSELKISSLTDFLTSIGLPMYIEMFSTHGCVSVEELLKLSPKDIQDITNANKKHMKRILHALEWVQKKLQSPTRRAAKVSPMQDKV